MMPIARNNRAMFARVLRRLLFANRGRLFVILLALSAGAAVSAALLNVQTDAKRRLTAEFRSFGPNIVVTPRISSLENDASPTLAEANFDQVPNVPINLGGKSGELYAIATVLNERTGLGVQAVLLGARFEGGVDPGLPRFEEFAGDLPRTDPFCVVGSKVAAALSVHARDKILLRKDSREESCRVFMIWSAGDERDSQISTNLALVQRLAVRPSQLSVIRIRVPGSAESIESYAALLQQKIQDAEVRPLRQFSEAQAKIYSRISGLLTAATALILALTILCVMAAMTNIAAERRNDVGMMKAIGGSARSVLSLFLTEAVVLGFAGGLIGAAIGIVISIWLGKAVFGVAAAPRLIVYPISVALTVLVAILGAYPLRRLVNIRPATVFRGEA